MLIIIPKKANIIICPAFIFANNLTANAKGFVNNPITSTIIIIGKIQKGTPGVAKICFQKSLLPKIIYVKNVINAKPAVTLRDAVAVALEGIRPNRLTTTIKKKNVKIRGKNFTCRCKILY